MDPSRWMLASVVIAAGLIAAPAQVAAHVGFVKRQIPVAASVETQLRTPHGCNGSPTVRLRMRLPKTVTAARPHPKPGWSISMSGEGVAREVIWTGRLPANQSADFPISFDLDASVRPGDVLYFPVVQECEAGVLRWIDMKGRPSAETPDGEPDDESTSPAPSIKLLPRR